MPTWSLATFLGGGCPLWSPKWAIWSAGSAQAPGLYCAVFAARGPPAPTAVSHRMNAMGDTPRHRHAKRCPPSQEIVGVEILTFP